MNTKVERNNIILTYIGVSTKTRFFRVSHKKDYAVVLNNKGPAISLRVFDSLLYGEDTCKPGEAYLNFIKFYPLCTWNELKKLMTGSNVSRPAYTISNIDELSCNQYERLCELLCISPKDYAEFRFLFATQEKLNCMALDND